MRKTNVLTAAALALATALAMPAHAADGCLSDEAVATLAAHYEAKTPAANPPADLSEAAGACTRAKLQAQLQAKMGKPIGYKAGLTNPAVQKRFDTDKPVWGVLYENMVLKSGATVDARFGARPLFEADLLVRVSSAAINQAKTPEEVLAAIDQVIPFMELPDLLVEAPPNLNGAGVTAINVGARLGIAGEPIAVPADAAGRQQLIAQLANMQVILKDATGKELSAGKGSDVLGQPLNAVVWLARALAEQAMALKPGDLVSVGSFSALLPPEAGQTITLEYQGLANAKPVSVSFR